MNISISSLKKSNKPRERIISAAYKLFYSKGFSETGINEILEESGSHKASLYRYFESKTDLGKITLSLEQARFLSFLKRALLKFGNYSVFVNFWVKTVKRTMTGPFGRGCPFVRYFQTGNEPNFNDIIRDVFRQAEILLTDYFIKSAGMEKGKAENTAAKALTIYEGSVQMVVLKNDPGYFSVMEQLLLDII